MRFCKNCDNMLYLGVGRENNNEVKHYCRCCGHSENSGEICVINMDTATQSKIPINEYTKYDPTLPHLHDMLCVNPECASHSTEPKDVIYMRYNESGMEYVYMCCVCDSTWTTNKRG